MLIQLSLAACILIAVNGSPTKVGCSSPIEKHPYVVSIECNNVHVGGGSIISRYYILTTAPVVSEAPDLDLLSVRTGSNFSNKYGSVHNVCDVKIHPSWRANYADALAVIRIVRPIIFDATRQPIRLLYDSMEWDTNATVSGWRNLFVPGYSKASLSIFEGIRDKNCTKIAVFCVDRPFDADWDQSAGRGHPLVVDGMQAGILVDSDNSDLMHVVDVARYAVWVDRVMKELAVGRCSGNCKGNSK